MRELELLMPTLFGLEGLCADELRRLDLPAHLSNKALLAVLNALYAPEELTQLLASAEEEMEPDGE